MIEGGCLNRMANRAVPVFGSYCSLFLYSRMGKARFPTGPAPVSVPGKTVLTVPVSGSGSVPDPLCFS